jgi:hypothetical protein
MNPYHKVALAIKSCHKYADRRQAQLDTWLKGVNDYFFFVIGSPQVTVPNALMCDSSDEFANIAPKVLGAVEHALEEGVTDLVVADDDTYIYWDRMLRSGFERFDYLGFVRNYGSHPYMQGSCYTLSERAMRRIMKNSFYMKNGVPDDVAVGQCLYGEVPFTHEHRFSIGMPYPEAHLWPQKGNNVIACHKMNPQAMRLCHTLLTQ